MPSSPQDRELILLTGGNGLIGRRLQSALRDDDYRVVCLDVQPPPEPVEDVSWMPCDLTDDDAVPSVMQRVRQQHGQRIASVIHLAAYYDFSGKPSPLYDTLTVDGTRRLIRALHEFDVGQLIFSSSLLVMEPVNGPDAKLTEDSPTRAEWDYPRSKLEAERVLREERGEIPVTVLRVAGVYDEECHSLPLAQYIRRIYEKQLESYVFPGDKHCGQSFIHLDDLTQCFLGVIEARSQLSGFEIFLVGEPEVMSHADLQERLGELIHGKKWPSLRIPKPIAKAGAWLKQKLPGPDPFVRPWMINLADDHYPVQVRRLRRRINWEPRHRLSATLESMVETLRQDPQRWYEIHHLPFPARLQHPMTAKS